MPNENDDADENSAEDMFVSIDRTELGRLLTVTAETIDFEDHGDFVVVDLDDLRWLEDIAFAKQLARCDDNAN